MVIEWMRGVLVRDLAALKREIGAYADEGDIWTTPAGTTNSAGNLTLHLVGNIQHFIGAQFGGTGYTRDRDAEFNRRDVPRAELLRHLDDAIAVVERTMPGLRDADLAAPYPLPIANATITTGDFFLHIAVHLTYHLGQVDYHRRIVTGEAGKIGAVSPLELATAVKSA